MNSPADEAQAAPGDESLETTVDAFQGGRFHLVQPKGRGFRAGLDALLLAASLPPLSTGRAADLGAGGGAASLAAAVRCDGLSLVLVERDPQMADLARRSLALPGNAPLAARLRVVEADVLGRRAAREAAGLFDGAFSTVLTNPPFHPAGGRGSPDLLRETALTMPGPDFIAGWIRTAAALLENGGLLVMIVRPDTLPDLLAAAGNRLGDIRILPVHARAERKAIRLLVHARRGSRAGLSLLPPAVLQGPEGRETALSEAVATGGAIEFPALF